MTSITEDVHPFLVLEPEEGHDSVRAWSAERLSFEPKGWQKEFRERLRRAVNQLDGDQDSVLHTIFISPNNEVVDVENILLYNVGTGYFERAAHSGLRFERVFGMPPDNPAPMTGQPRHYQYYALASRNEDFDFWRASERYAQWVTTIAPVTPSTKAVEIWQSMKQGSVRILSKPSHRLTRFGVRINIRVPSSASRFNTASLVKPILDGVISSFHEYDGSDSYEIEERLTRILGVEKSTISEYLADSSTSILGPRNSITCWRDGVKMNPADDGCVAGELLVSEEATDGAWEMSGEIFRVNEAVI